MSEIRIKEGDRVHYSAGQGAECEKNAVVARVRDDPNGLQYAGLRLPHSAGLEDKEIQFCPGGRILPDRSCHFPGSCPEPTHS